MKKTFISISLCLTTILIYGQMPLKYSTIKRIYDFNCLNADKLSKSKIRSRWSGSSTELPTKNLPINLNFDDNGRIFQFVGINAIYYDKNNFISEVFVFDWLKGQKKYTFHNDSLGNLLSMTSASDTFTVNYNESNISYAYRYPGPYDFPIDSARIGERISGVDSIDFAFNRSGKMIYLKEDNIEYYFQGDLIVKEFSSPSPYDNNYHEENFMYVNNNLKFQQSYDKYCFYKNLYKETYSNSTFDYDSKNYVITARTVSSDDYQIRTEKIFLDENYTPIYVESYIGDSLENSYKTCYEYDKDKQVFSLLHPKDYVKQIVKSKNDTGFEYEINNVKYHIKFGRLTRIVDEREPNVRKIYHIENDTLWGYTELNDLQNSSSFFLIKNDSIKFLQSEKIKIGTTPEDLSSRLLKLKENYNHLNVDLSKYEYQLYFSTKEVRFNNQVIVLSKNDINEKNYVWTSNPKYKISKIVYGYDEQDIIQSKYIDKLMENISLGKEKGIRIYITNKKGYEEIMNLNIKRI